MDVGSVRALASPEGQSLLRALGPYDEGSVLTLQRDLRADGHPPEVVAAALTQLRLRARARLKFGEFAEDMLFTPDGLEQASRIEVATTHAHRFSQASIATVHDLGCGIGADAITLSVLGVTVQAIDNDPVTAAIADANLRPWPDSRARCADARDFEAPPDAGRNRVGAWFDPARRRRGIADITGRIHRVFSLDEISPSWEFVQSVAAQVPATGTKMSPSFPHERIPVGTEAQWTSWEGSVVECAIWWGPLVKTPGRTARILTRDKAPIEIGQWMADPDPQSAGSLSDVGPWLYEADRAVIQADLMGAVTMETGGLEVDRGMGYVIADRPVELAYARRYVVHEAMPFNAKSLRIWLRERGITGVTIKKRGVRLNDDALRQDLGIGRKAGDGDQTTIVITRLGGRQVVFVVSAV